jgi:hypothetical protein
MELIFSPAKVNLKKTVKLYQFSKHPPTYKLFSLNKQSTKGKIMYLFPSPPSDFFFCVCSNMLPQYSNFLKLSTSLGFNVFTFPLLLQATLSNNISIPIVPFLKKCHSFLKLTKRSCYVQQVNLEGP